MVVHLKPGVFGGVRIDRRTRWGNPCPIKKGERDRWQALTEYCEYLLRPNQAWIWDKAPQELKGKYLECWCKPDDCHGDILAAIADGIITREAVTTPGDILAAVFKTERGEG